MMSRNVTDPNYSLMSVRDFFGGSDHVRFVIIIYIFISFIFNIFNFVVVGIIYCKTKKINLGILVTSGILFVNFSHTFAYFFQWVIKSDDVITKTIDGIEVGALLTGNPTHFFACTAQAFILISTSISQDFIINIFFYMITKDEEDLKKKLIIICLIILGVIFPIGFTLFYLLEGALGINDKFCYVSKFKFNITNNYVEYKSYDNFELFVMIIYAIRVVNFFVTFFFLIKIIKYVKAQNESKIYIFKSIIIPIIQLFTIFIGVLYRLVNIISPTNSQISWIYLVLNSSDGVLFPIIFMFLNNVFQSLKYIFSKEIDFKENNNNRLMGDKECEDDE